MPSPASIEIMQALRTALKSRNITYKQVAQKIKVSEQTVKRLFRDQDCSLSRLTEVCEAIGISIYELLEFSKYHTRPLAKLSPEQEDYLKDRPSHFAFLFFLTTGYTIADIKARYQLSELRLFRYLRDLQGQGFIELGEENKFRLLVEGKLLMRLHGPLHETVRRLNHLFLNYVIDNDGNSGVDFNSSFRFMTRTTLDNLNDELMTVTRKYRKIAEQEEMILPRKKLLPAKWTTLVAEFEICGEWPLEQEVDP